MNIVIRTKDEAISWENLVELLHEAFQERLEQGLNFTCSFMSAADLRQQLENCTVFIAVDTDNGMLVGMAAMDVNKSEEGLCAYMLDLAVKPQYKRCGIMALLHQKLVEMAKANGCEYITSDTATLARSSVMWHKKNGFKIIGLDSFSSTNYYSYIFRKQLVPDSLWCNSLYCWLHYLYSALRCKIRFHADGKNTKLMNFYLKMRGVK